jgi:hypothetical protein
MACKAALMLLCLTSCSACRYGVEPIIVRTEANRVKADGLMINLHCK